jgi:hypothetical protein
MYVSEQAWTDSATSDTVTTTFGNRDVYGTPRLLRHLVGGTRDHAMVRTSEARSRITSELHTDHLGATRDQESCLHGKRFQHARWVQDRPNWDHDHCEYCWATLSAAPADLNFGYTDARTYYWICEACWADFGPEIEEAADAAEAAQSELDRDAHDERRRGES